MLDLKCFSAGAVRILCPFILLYLWRKKKQARIYPALIAFAMCFPVFIIGGAIRSGFSRENYYSFYIQQGLLFGILEEGAKFLLLKFYFADRYGKKGAVTYGIGHGIYEELGAGFACFALIGEDTAAPEIFWFNLWAATEGAAFVISLTILIYYGIYTERSIPLGVYFTSTRSLLFLCGHF